MKKIIILALVGYAFLGCDRDTDFIITIKTSYGDMKAILYDDTPQHKENFLKLAKEGRYDSSIFHRVINKFMIQGGDLARTGEPANWTVPSEFVKKRFHKKGALAAARQPDQYNPDKASSGSQFYIVQGKTWTEKELTVDQGKLNEAVGTLFRMPGYDSIREACMDAYQAQDFDRYSSLLISLVPDIKKKLGQDVTKDMDPRRIEAYTTIGGYPFLDDEYTVYGQVFQGLEVIDKIAAVGTASDDNPLETIYMVVEVEELPKKKITKLYGINYEESN